ncbi:MAG: tRNA (adenosine(37)-N6)-threonylcarbamoyltransferase complex transferase subunit TsaD [Candidatus Shikimatogenerans bostrichidophilus]|nr:MAG: tRNA (adenosine(37)-N6)-threonylcarbamoyltransferase complex transferase subunit TsaD [Candidatus Shikimatogenerans bostrichidophilus]
MDIKKKILNNNKIILGIETSFDDTSCAILKGKNVLSNIIYKQKIHNKYLGVKPSLAYDTHLVKIYQVVKRALKKAYINMIDINIIAYTKGPGLIGSLMIGEHFAKSLAISLNLPLIGINHVHGHIYSIFLNKKNTPTFPYICLSISGGHTKLLIIKDFFKIKSIGETLDESVGILIDKISILLGFKYTQGPNLIDKYAKKGKFIFKFPIPNVKNFNFSFSGLITYIKNIIKKKKNNIKKDICRSLLETIFIIFKIKILNLIKLTNIKNIVITGGVISNFFLKKKFQKFFLKKKINLFINSNKNYLIDNAAMIALVGNIKSYYNLYEDFKCYVDSNLDINKL